MKLDRFISERKSAWKELEELIAAARGRPERLGPDGVRRLGHLYRGSAADLALARRRWPGDPTTRRLEEIAAGARVLVYHSPSHRRSLFDFISSGYWQQVRARPAALLIAAGLLIVPWILATSWAISDPEAAANVVPEEYQSVTEAREPGTDLGMSAAEEAAFSSFIFTNNIQVSFWAFAGGILAGIGTAYVLLTNAVLLGTVMGLAVEAGNAVPFLELVTAHGLLELSCIVVGAAAGLRLGWAVIDPGHRRRVDALKEEARPAVEIVLGTALWLVVAGLVEGFVTPAGWGLLPALAVGIALAGLYWSLVWFRGSKDPAPSYS
ncbi:MAG TPA: stage II sporulation protein M [Actinomycetota bacterium]|nr:stage II sporulation protein M [Actinomycetota bacterium]